MVRAELRNSLLRGRSILVVEDSFLIADTIQAELAAAGCQVKGPYGRLQQGVKAATMEKLDGAFLDVNLAGEFSYPIADVLIERGVPFAFLTGYGDIAIPDEYRYFPRISKPFVPKALIDAALRFVGGR